MGTCVSKCPAVTLTGVGGKFGGISWAGGFRMEVTSRPGPREMMRCRVGPESHPEFSRLGSGFGVELCWVGGADQLD